jgi:hypothetical protein
MHPRNIVCIDDQGWKEYRTIGPMQKILSSQKIFPKKERDNCKNLNKRRNPEGNSNQ